VHFEGDPTRLTQSVLNLLNNAAKYTEPGGEIRLSAGPEGDEVVIRVRDNGIGIPQENLKHVFDVFTHDRGDAHAQGGLGIGLVLVKGVVTLHGGSVEAHSDGPGCGSEFVLRLPLQPRPRAGEAA
jgi:signal transduction histidine kinase